MYNVPERLPTLASGRAADKTCTGNKGFAGCAAFRDRASLRILGIHQEHMVATFLLWLG